MTCERCGAEVEDLEQHMKDEHADGAMEDSDLNDEGEYGDEEDEDEE
ncbi:MAG: hypothetical protein HYZ09_00735 [Candidatus Kerfeldbacteria bacterium]|nr:hypothetical protein [Candidatus Kerfeldbacteria bacterium]